MPSLNVEDGQRLLRNASQAIGGPAPLGRYLGRRSDQEGESPGSRGVVRTSSRSSFLYPGRRKEQKMRGLGEIGQRRSNERFGGGGGWRVMRRAGGRVVVEVVD